MFRGLWPVRLSVLRTNRGRSGGPIGRLRRNILPYFAALPFVSLACPTILRLNPTPYYEEESNR